MQERHRNFPQYFAEQGFTTLQYVIPFISEFLPITPDTTVLEIGCGQAGNLKPFLDLGCKCAGVDIYGAAIEIGKQFYKEHKNAKNLQLIAEDIYNLSGDNFKFDLVFLRDVIEHIPNQAKFMEHLKSFLNPGGRVFFGFPPWQQPFGGHQQIANSIVQWIPWIHLLPTKLYKKVLEWAESGDNTAESGERRAESGERRAESGERRAELVDGLLQIKATGISIERFNRILGDSNFIIEKETLYLINPNYDIKFGLKPRKLCSLLGLIPYLRNFYTTAVYCVVKSGD